MQDKGVWPQGLVIDLWGSATMRTAGEELAMALHLAGLAPKWDAGSERVSGFEIPVSYTHLDVYKRQLFPRRAHGGRSPKVNHQPTRPVALVLQMAAQQFLGQLHALRMGLSLIHI